MALIGAAYVREYLRQQEGKDAPGKPEPEPPPKPEFQRAFILGRGSTMSFVTSGAIIRTLPLRVEEPQPQPKYEPFLPTAPVKRAITFDD